MPLRVNNSETLKNAARAIMPRPIRTWLRSPSRSGKYLVDSTAFWLGVRKALQFPDDDWSILCHPHAYRFARENQIGDAEQREEFRVFRLHCNRQTRLFDVGAHFGIFSLAAAKAGGQAIAVEPSPMAVRMIATQAVLNGVTANIRTLRSAAGSTDGTIELLSAGTFSYGYFKAAKGRLKRELTEVPMVTVDSLAAQFGAPTHLKIDVEGYEEQVLHGAQATLGAHSPLVFLELHNEIIRSEGGHPNAVLDRLTGFGYSLHALSGAEYGCDFFVRAPVVRLLAKRSVGTATPSGKP